MPRQARRYLEEIGRGKTGRGRQLRARARARARRQCRRARRAPRTSCWRRGDARCRRAGRRPRPSARGGLSI